MMKALSNHDEFSCHELKYSYSTTTYDIGSLCQCFAADVPGFWLAVCSAVSENRKTVAVEQRQNQPKVKLRSARIDLRLGQRAVRRTKSLLITEKVFFLQPHVRC